MFDDRIEITSAGSLPDGFSEKEFFEGISAPRNKELMRIYRDLELVEPLGSGVPRILKSYDKSCFRFFPNFIRMTFPKFMGGQIGGQVNKIFLTKRQQQVLELIKENPAISRSQLASKVGINESAVQKHIDTLRVKKMIEREGGKRGYWNVKS
ncbi:ATP-binding protein [Sphingobacterium olei]|uniref:ATP-binding protein n=1 Tax=Sphingobacterium olei TaxID=2571155 RepID=UPI0021D36102|nr:ATP-binding protein [Sphingobacterium olei]